MLVQQPAAAGRVRNMYRLGKNVLMYTGFFFRNAYLLQERRDLAPAKDTEAKTRFRR